MQPQVIRSFLLSSLPSTVTSGHKSLMSRSYYRPEIPYVPQSVANWIDTRNQAVGVFIDVNTYTYFLNTRNAVHEKHMQYLRSKHIFSVRS